MEWQSFMHLREVSNEDKGNKICRSNEDKSNPDILLLIVELG